MEKSKTILQEAIIEAKQLRDAAIEQAYESLKENLTPSIKSMLENKLKEEIEISDEGTEDLEESALSGFKEVKAPKKAIKEAEEEEKEEEAPESEEAAEEVAATEEPDGDEEGGEANGEHEEPDGDEPEETEAEPEAPAEEEVEVASDDTKLEDLTLGDLKTLVSDLVAQLQAAPAPEGEEGVDMVAADVEGAGEEEAPIGGDDEEVAIDGVEAEEAPETEAPAEEEEDEEIDLAEILKELETEESNRKVATHSQDKENVKTELKEAKAARDKALATVSELKETIADVNLMNSKLQYITRMLSENNLSERQKAAVIKSFDAAKSPKEVKTVYNTLNESMKNNINGVLKEHRGVASRFAGASTKNNNIIEVDSTVRRFQQLAGIID